MDRSDEGIALCLVKTMQEVAKKFFFFNGFPKSRKFRREPLDTSQMYL
jgi:hypothetical protein